MGKKMKEQKRCSKQDIALEVSVNGVTHVFVVHFQSLDTF